MITSKAHHNVRERMEFQETCAYALDVSMTSHLARVLRDMYSLPILAVFREYLANAVDAHTSIGQTLPIEIQLPDEGRLEEPNTLVIRDFGPGMDKEATRKNLFCFGGSTKRSDNDAVGGFGIGSKSGYCTGDSFVYTVWHGGMKRVWFCSLDSRDDGRAGLLSEEPSDEPTGVEVRLPFTDEQRSDMRYIAGFLLSVYDGPVKFDLGGDEEALMKFETRYEGDGWSVLSYDSKYRGWSQSPTLRQFITEKNDHLPIICTMGGIPYPVVVPPMEQTPPAMNAALWSFLGSSSQRYLIVFRKEIGDLPVAPNRESLMYSEDTRKKIADDIARLSIESLPSEILDETLEAADPGDRARMVFEFLPAACSAAGIRFSDEDQIRGSTYLMEPGTALAKGLTYEYVRTLIYTSFPGLQAANKQMPHAYHTNTGLEVKLAGSLLTYPVTRSTKEYFVPPTSSKLGVSLVKTPSHWRHKYNTSPESALRNYRSSMYEMKYLALGNEDKAGYEADLDDDGKAVSLPAGAARFDASAFSTCRCPFLASSRVSNSKGKASYIHDHPETAEILRSPMIAKVPGGWDLIVPPTTIVMYLPDTLPATVKRANAAVDQSLYATWLAAVYGSVNREPGFYVVVKGLRAEVDAWLDAHPWTKDHRMECACPPKPVPAPRAPKVPGAAPVAKNPDAMPDGARYMKADQGQTGDRQFSAGEETGDKPVAYVRTIRGVLYGGIAEFHKADGPLVAASDAGGCTGSQAYVALQWLRNNLMADGLVPKDADPFRWVVGLAPGAPPPKGLPHLSVLTNRWLMRYVERGTLLAEKFTDYGGEYDNKCLGFQGRFTGTLGLTWSDFDYGTCDRRRRPPTDDKCTTCPQQVAGRLLQYLRYYPGGYGGAIKRLGPRSMTAAFLRSMKKHMPDLADLPACQAKMRALELPRDYRICFTMPDVPENVRFWGRFFALSDVLSDDKIQAQWVKKVVDVTQEIELYAKVGIPKLPLLDVMVSPNEALSVGGWNKKVAYSVIEYVRMEEHK